MSRSGFRPQLDALEARDVPAVSIYVLDGGETLKIVGSKASDEVRITQDDASNTLEIASGLLPKIPGKELLDSSSYTFNSSRVKNIIVDLGIGNDAFYYSLAEDSDLLHAKTLTINTGPGDDLVNINTAVPRPDLTAFYRAEAERYARELALIQPGDYDKQDPRAFENLVTADIQFCVYPPMHSVIRADLVLNIDTGNGHDRVDINLGEIESGRIVRIVGNLGNGDDTFTLTGNHDVGSNASVFVDVNTGAGDDFVDASFHGYIADRGLVDVLLNGGAGNDHLNVGFFNRVDGRLNVRQFGGAGQDEISFHSDADDGSTGLVSVLLEGGDDDDTITYSAVGLDDPARTNVFIDGGTGFNIGKLSRNVMCVNLNDILWLPPLV